jgi:hypothetical protein
MFARLRPGPPEQTENALPSSGVRVVDLRGLHYPVTATLISAASDRAISISPDGTHWHAAQLDEITPELIAFGIMAPVGYLRFVGDPGDVWSID